MPQPSAGATEAPTPAGPVGRRSALLRLVTGAALVLTALAVPAAADPGAVAAGSSCTGWTSYASPPRTIRVLDSRTGVVRTVAFRKYVAQVMASGEWPSRLRMATLEAGALATKQYAWYYAMKGHHRSGYASGGRCYDVKDSTQDQLYRSWVKPSARQQRAVKRTWDLTLRKNGRFFLTGYRAGRSATCAADADGWKLYARSVEACAKQGWSSRRIIERYLSPDLAFVRSRTMGPVLRPPTIRLATGNVLPGAAVIAWSKLSGRDNVARYHVQRRVGGGTWKDVTLDHARTRSTDAWLKTGTANRFRVRARDTRGQLGPWALSPARKAAIRGPKGLELGGETQIARATPGRVKVRFKGRSAAFVTAVGPGMGRAKVIVDGRKVAILDLERERQVVRKLVWAHNWSRVKDRVIVIKAGNTSERVTFDGIFTLR